MSWAANDWARKVRVGDSKLKLLLIMLSNYANEAGECWHSQERISFDTEIPIRTLRRKLADLELKGLIEIIERRRDDGTRASHLIRLVAPLAAKMAGGADDSERSETLTDAGNLTTGQKRHRPKTGVTTGQKTGSPPATWMAAQESYEPKESSKCIRAREAEAFFENEFWPRYPKRLGGNPKQPAKALIVAAVVSGENPANILAAVDRLVEEKRATGALGTEMVPMAQTWARRKTWRDGELPTLQPGAELNSKPRGQESFFSIATDAHERSKARGH